MNTLKNFAINQILRHIADNPKLNKATNLLALVPVILIAALNGHADWTLMISYVSHPTPAGLVEIARVVGLVIVAVLLWFTGKFPWLKSWLPVAQEIIAEAQKEATQEPAGK